jgi:hypothetical protein
MCRVLHVPLTVVQVIWKKKKKKFPNSVVELCFFFFLDGVIVLDIKIMLIILF